MTIYKERRLIAAVQTLTSFKWLYFTDLGGKYNKFGIFQ